MRALVCTEHGPAEKLAIQDLPTPTPGPGEIQVAVRAAALNFPDNLVIRGEYQVKTQPPFVPGSEAAGIVTAVGEGARGFREGDSVIALPTLGAFAETCTVHAARAMPIPPGVDFATAAAFSVTYGTTYHAYRQLGRLAAGETVLVLGAAGGVGVSAVQLAKAMGATVIAAASSADKLAFAAEAGADHGINYAEESLRDRVRELTDDRGVDVVYDPVGGDQAQAALRSLAWQGRYLVIGFASGTIPQFPANIALLKEASIIGVWWGTWMAKDPSLGRQNIVELFDLLVNGRIAPQVTERYAFEDYLAAFDAIVSRRARGKVVLEFPEA
ncbi:MAG: NADPH:quinone oxidoreductase family protein [Pseudomonadota bacterium]